MSLYEGTIQAGTGETIFRLDQNLGLLACCLGCTLFADNRRHLKDAALQEKFCSTCLGATNEDPLKTDIFTTLLSTGSTPRELLETECAPVCLQHPIPIKVSFKQIQQY